MVRCFRQAVLRAAPIARAATPSAVPHRPAQPSPHPCRVSPFPKFLPPPPPPPPVFVIPRPDPGHAGACARLAPPPVAVALTVSVPVPAGLQILTTTGRPAGAVPQHPPGEQPDRPPPAAPAGATTQPAAPRFEPPRLWPHRYLAAGRAHTEPGGVHPQLPAVTHASGGERRRQPPQCVATNTSGARSESAGSERQGRWRSSGCGRRAVARCGAR
jgi:hypothetical protein